jgi:hypothetical protein
MFRASRRPDALDDAIRGFLVIGRALTPLLAGTTWLVALEGGVSGDCRWQHFDVKQAQFTKWVSPSGQLTAAT